MMTTHQCFKAECQTLLQKCPELLLISLCQNTDLCQADNTLIKSSLKLIFSVFILPRCQEAAAAHTGKYVSFIILPHHLGRDIIRIHSLGTALHRQLREIVVLAALQAVMLVQYIDQLWKSRCHIDTLFVFDALNALLQYLLNDHGIFLYIRIVLVQIQE